VAPRVDEVGLRAECYNRHVKSEKQAIIELLDKLPEDVSTETVITELQFRALILRRGEDAEAGRNLISHDEMKAHLAKWLTSAGT